MTEFSRYQRQMLMPTIGEAGQRKLAAATVLIIGCGALGCGSADLLARAGVGRLRIVDRDIVELSNLQRQTLFSEEDAKLGRAKAEAAAIRLRHVNSKIVIEPLVADVSAQNIEDFLLDASRQPCDIIADGTDNVLTRFLINDVAAKHDIPWVYGGAVGAQGRVMAIHASRGPCLRCVFPEAPQGRDLATCDTAGILAPASAVVSALQAMAIIQLLTGDPSPLERLLTMDLLTARLRQVDPREAKSADCACCGRKQFDFLDATGDAAAALCGRDAVQIRPTKRWTSDDFATKREQLKNAGEVHEQAYFARCQLRDPGGITITLFHDGRVLIGGTADAGRARAIHARYIGE